MFFVGLIHELDELADEVIEEGLTPEECSLRIERIIEHYQNVNVKLPAKHAVKCLDDLLALQETIASERSTPDVIQEYLFYMIDYYSKLQQNTGEGFYGAGNNRRTKNNRGRRSGNRTVLGL